MTTTMSSTPGILSRIDSFLIDIEPAPALAGIRRGAVEFLFFGVKEARACLFAGLFFLSIFIVPRGGVFGIPRYDILLLVALTIQAMMLITRLETLDELKAICLFHLIGFCREEFKTSGGIQP